MSEETISHPLLAIDSGSNLTTRPEHSQHDTSTEDNMNTLSSVGKGYQDSITRKQRCGMLEILFESYHAPAAFLSPTPMVASFAHGRQTSLVVDIGAMGMRVTPIVDGFL
jgi:actin-related protein